MKICIGCNEELELQAFYKHKDMKDGHLGRCKECCKEVNNANRRQRVEYYRSYDRERSNLTKRVKARSVYAGSKEGRESLKRGKKEWAARNKEKRSAHSIFWNGIKSGKVVKKPCEICGETKVHGHHEDYKRPLDVIWLCDKHHILWHKIDRIRKRFNRNLMFTRGALSRRASTLRKLRSFGNFLEDI